VPASPDEMRDTAAVLGMDRRHKMLLRSLQEHTRGKVRWQGLDEWEHAWGNCLRGLGELRKEALNLDNGLLNRIKEDSGEKDPSVKITHAVLETIWQRVLQDKLDPERPVVHAVPYNQQVTVLKPIEFSDYYILSFIDKKLPFQAEEATNQAAKNLLKGDLVKQLAAEVRTMRKVIEEVDDALDPFILRPQILRTRCELCPA